MPFSGQVSWAGRGGPGGGLLLGTRRLGQVWGRRAVAGVCVSGGSPRCRRTGVAEILVVMAMLLAFWGGVGAGSPAPLGVHPTCESRCWGGGRRSPRPPSPGARGWGDVGSLCSARLSYRRPRPLPRLPPPPAPVSQPPAALGWHPIWGQGPGVLTCGEGQEGTGSRARCRLTVRSRADQGRSCLVRVGSRRLGLKRQTGLGGRWAPWTSSVSSSSPVLGTDELFLGITHSWKCELASSSYTPTESFACLWYKSPQICLYSCLLPLPPPIPQVYSSCSRAPQPVLQNRHRPPSSPTTCGPISLAARDSPSPVYLWLPPVPHLPCLEPFCLESLSQGVQ